MSLTSKLQIIWGIGFLWGVLLHAVLSHDVNLMPIMLVSAVPMGLGMAGLQHRWFK